MTEGLLRVRAGEGQAGAGAGGVRAPPGLVMLGRAGSLPRESMATLARVLD